jgi:hypothetical protein
MRWRQRIIPSPIVLLLTACALQGVWRRRERCADVPHVTLRKMRVAALPPRACNLPQRAAPAAHTSRRGASIAAIALALSPPLRSAAATLATGSAASPSALSAAADLADLAELAAAAAGARDFGAAEALYTSLLERDAPAAAPRWLEARAAARVDGKAFDAARRDYAAALAECERSGCEPRTTARLLSGDALAAEGQADWRGALTGYDAALAITPADPYALNARGNVLGALDRWADARDSYLASGEAFSSARGLPAVARAEGAAFARSNAALALAQTGDVAGAAAEAGAVLRRFPGSVDMRAAAAALAWARNDGAAAEEAWDYACDRITTGCARFRDAAWVTTVRRWPPRPAAALADFLALRRPG